MKKSLSGILLGLFLTGCASLPPPQPVADAEILDTPMDPVIYRTGEFNRESLFELLSAEMAGQLGQYEKSLDIYLRQTRLSRDPVIAERATRIAQFLRNHDATIHAAILWSEISPENLEPSYIASTLLLQGQQFEEALPLLERILRDPDADVAQLISSQSENFTPEMALRYLGLLDQISESQPHRADLTIARSMLYRQIGDDGMAIRLLDEGLKLSPQDPQLVLFKSEIYRLQGRFEEGFVLVSMALSEHPEDRRLQIQYAQMLLLNGELESADSAITELIKTYPDDRQLQLYLALLLLDNEQYDSSRELLEELLQSPRPDSRVHYYLGQIAELQEDPEQAIQHYLRIPPGESYLQSRAQVLMLLDSPDRYLRIKNLMTEEIRRHTEYQIDLSSLYAEWLQRNGYPEEAIEHLTLTLNQHPDEIRLLYARAMLLDTVDPEQMLQDLYHAYELDPNNPTLQNALGYTLTVHTDQYDTAYELITAALAQRPDDSAILDSMGWVLFKMGELEDALLYLERAYDMFPDPEVVGHMVQVLWSLERHDEARALLNNNLNEYPDNHHLLEAAEYIGDPL
ncbi:tetratricopeptide repeat protein [Nitrincola sp. MINF-07-Sa-05]|uniref:tetratricopeptide repeat protein n=1 Tax=Nitrincola salilacus TaxID=3400273 RepID=UPI0039183912